jgi:calcineurin-binding protein cabin-1
MNYHIVNSWFCSESRAMNSIAFNLYLLSDKFPVHAELDEIQSCLDSALDQAFFCLYGLKINPDSCSEDDLAVHKNTSRGDYQTKEQCADVFQYVLPYAKALSVSNF